MPLMPLPGSAPATTDLGMLQRGRGAGWLAAANGTTGVERLLECIANDPRWDSQVERRSDYYATLALRLAIAPATIADLALAAAEDDLLPRDVLDAMARRGSADAHVALAGLPPLLDDEDVRPVRRPPCPSLDEPLDILLRTIGPRCGTRFVQRFAATTDRRELQALQGAALDPELLWGRRHALEVLGLRGDLVALGWAEQILAADTLGFEGAAALGYVIALPSRVTLPLSRSWLAVDDRRGQAARKVLAKHAQAEDSAAIQAALPQVVDDNYAICDLVTALGRIPEHGPYPLLDVVYTESQYSYARARAAAAIAATDPTFGPRIAPECLWDCEDPVRILGVNHAPRTAVVAERLRELADESGEDPDVREAARRRIAGSPV
ncbi:hypothetical protein [Promicromonospora sp. NPDC059942]|uniref:hypothetical protein n=1 Tax=Promicromonospora sp. NPDC059942 TaxID=3347009 RepID=UPI003663D226